MITVELNNKESLLVQAAIRAEIVMGQGTFLSSDDIIALGDILHLLENRETQ